MTKEERLDELERRMNEAWKAIRDAEDAHQVAAEKYEELYQEMNPRKATPHDDLLRSLYPVSRIESLLLKDKIK